MEFEKATENLTEIDYRRPMSRLKSLRKTREERITEKKKAANLRLEAEIG